MRYFIKENTDMVHKHIGRCATSLDLRKIHIKTHNDIALPIYQNV